MKKVSVLQSVLTVIYVCSLLISNIVVFKQIEIFGITLTGGEFVFPLVYILSDVFSEAYGYKWSRITCNLALTMNLFMVFIFALAIMSPYPSYFDGQAAFEMVLGNTPRALLASCLALVVGDYVNDRVFQAMKEKHKDSFKGFGWRAIISSLVGEIADSCVCIPILFAFEMPIEAMIAMIVFQVIIKTGYELLILPFTTLVTKKVIAYELK